MKRFLVMIFLVTVLAGCNGFYSYKEFPSWINENHHKISPDSSAVIYQVQDIDDTTRIWVNVFFLIEGKLIGRDVFAYKPLRKDTLQMSWRDFKHIKIKIPEGAEVIRKREKVQIMGRKVFVDYD